jgi:hypothetical protein
MRFLSLEQFLKIYSKNDLKDFDDFMRKTQVKIGSNLKPLNVYAFDKSISINDLQIIFENIVNRNEYLTRFYVKSLKVDDTPMHEEKPMTATKMNNNEKINYKNVIRNMFYKEILYKTKSGFENNPTYMQVLADFYLHNIIDYKLLTPSALHYIREGHIGGVFSSFYFRASIMNPYLVYSLNHSLLKGEKIFTPTLGWGSYCYGFLECPLVKEYVGTDVIPSVCKKVQNFADAFYPERKTVIYCEPSEDLAKNSNFRKKYREHFDIVFFSPPYFRLELYSGGEQSTTRYKSYDEWLHEYWKKTIELCYHVLVPGGKMCYILSGYGSENTTQYDLLNDMNSISKDVFHSSPRKLNMYNKDVHVTKHRETDEKIIIFKK